LSTVKVIYRHSFTQNVTTPCLKNSTLSISVYYCDYNKVSTINRRVD